MKEYKYFNSSINPQCKIRRWMILSSKIRSLFAIMTIRKETKAEDHLFEHSSKGIPKGSRIDLMEYLSSKYVNLMLLLPEDKDKCAQET